MPLYLSAPGFLRERARREHLPFSDNKVNEFVISKIAAIEESSETKVIYSDLNFILLGFLAERLFGVPVHVAYVTEVISRLRLVRFPAGLGTGGLESRWNGLDS